MPHGWRMVVGGVLVFVAIAVICVAVFEWFQIRRMR